MLATPSPDAIRKFVTVWDGRLLGTAPEYVGGNGSPSPVSHLSVELDGVRAWLLELSAGGTL